VHLHERLSSLREMLQSSLRGDVELAIDIPDGTWPVRVDPGELEIAFLNLAMNARDAMPKGGRLAIAARNRAAEGAGAARDEVIVTVTDTGSGIPPEILERVFEPFFTTKDVGKGTGLGLSQVYGFARQSGGHVAVDSRPGRTVFTLVLPRCEDLPEETAAPRLARPGKRRGRALLVEDNAEVAEVTVANLEELGLEVELAANVPEALSRVATGAFDIVVTDIVMPGGLNGLDLARTVRRHRPGLPVLMVSGYSAVGDEARLEGFQLLRKPYDLDALAAAVDALLESGGPTPVPGPQARTGT
jgi:two-component system NtrC family sensor kinase